MLLLAAASGCIPSQPRADLVICNGPDPETLDPALVRAAADLRITGALFEGLTRLNARTATPEPGLAERWDVLEDGRFYRFHLRTGLAWSTGEPIAAEDVVYSWQRVVDPRTAASYAGHLFFLRNAREINQGLLPDPAQLGVRARGPGVVEVELVSPTPIFLDLCASRALAVVPRQTIERLGDGWLKARPLPVSGPYQLESWRIQDKVRVRRNPRYWDAAEVGLELVDFLTVHSPTTALSLYERGQADIIWDKDLLPAELLDLLRAREDGHVFQYLATAFLRCNTTRRPFQDPRVRRALALALAKQRLVDRITRVGEQAASHLTPPGTAHYQPPDGHGFEPAQARRWLAEAGFPGGAGFPTCRLLFNAKRINQQLGVELQQMWQQELGIRMELRQTEPKVWLVAQTALDYDLCLASWIGDYNDPSTFLDLFLSDNPNNRTGWSSAEYDRLLRLANQQSDPQRRAALLREAEGLLVREELPIIPLYFYVGMNLFDPRKLEGIDLNVLDEHPIRAIRRRPSQQPAGNKGLN